MNLDDAQKQKIAAWIKEGLSLSEIQGKIASEWGIHLTYLEARFLVADLGAAPADKDFSEVNAPDVAPQGRAGSDSPAQGVIDQAWEAANGGPSDSGPGVSVTVDQITRVGAVVSGNVRFSDGNAAQWYLDQSGRLGLAPDKKGYRPPEEDLIEFQSELQNQLAKLGY
ncbi:MAG: hypothetical protein M1608_01335 [Candidatus Omnitrophica bacterium]|nr:hypothetical protein [Candidatus Omnitrophota bacterium]